MITVIEDGFEGGFEELPGVRKQIPIGWQQDYDHAGVDGWLVQPEWDQKFNDPEVLDGHSALTVHTRYATHRAVLYRRVSANIGLVYRWSLYCMGVDDPDGDSGHGMQIGIDPTGDINFRADTVVWSDWYSQYMDIWRSRKWHKLMVETEARRSYITIFLRSQSDHKRTAMAHFDNGRLEVEASMPGPVPDPNGETELSVLRDIRDLVRTIAHTPKDCACAGGS